MHDAAGAHEVPKTATSSEAVVAQAPGVGVGVSIADELNPRAVLALQRSAGNVAVQRALRRAPMRRGVLARSKDSDYNDAVKAGDWPLAAELLNGFSREDILS